MLWKPLCNLLMDVFSFWSHDVTTCEKYGVFVRSTRDERCSWVPCRQHINALSGCTKPNYVPLWPSKKEISLYTNVKETRALHWQAHNRIVWGLLVFQLKCGQIYYLPSQTAPCRPRRTFPVTWFRCGRWGRLMWTTSCTPGSRCHSLRSTCASYWDKAPLVRCTKQSPTGWSKAKQTLQQRSRSKAWEVIATMFLSDNLPKYGQMLPRLICALKIAFLLHSCIHDSG